MPEIKKIDLWVAVCTQMHSATGPFADPMQALAVAKSLTANSSSGCVYVPVLLHAEGQVTKYERAGGDEKAVSKETYGAGMYL